MLLYHSIALFFRSAALTTFAKEQPRSDKDERYQQPPEASLTFPFFMEALSYMRWRYTCSLCFVYDGRGCPGLKFVVRSKKGAECSQAQGGKQGRYQGCPILYEYCNDRIRIPVGSFVGNACHHGGKACPKQSRSRRAFDS